jgi:hypothetical protein
MYGLDEEPPAAGPTLGMSNELDTISTSSSSSGSIRLGILAEAGDYKLKGGAGSEVEVHTKRPTLLPKEEPHRTGHATEAPDILTKESQLHVG